MTKQFSERLFKINEHLTVSCRAESTRSGFRHLASLHRDGWIEAQAKVCYLNRTWESYEFQSVILELARKCEKERDYLTGKILREYANQDHYKDDGTFKMIATVAALGSILTDTPQQANDWKLRMIKAGLGNAIRPPDDWDTLSEDEKTRRLDAVIGELRHSPVS